MNAIGAEIYSDLEAAEQEVLAAAGFFTDSDPTDLQEFCKSNEEKVDVMTNMLQQKLSVRIQHTNGTNFGSLWRRFSIPPYREICVLCVPNHLQLLQELQELNLVSPVLLVADMTILPSKILP